MPSRSWKSICGAAGERGSAGPQRLNPRDARLESHKCRQHLAVRKICVAAARIGKNEHSGTLESLAALQAQGNRLAGGHAEDGAKERHADECHERRLRATDFFLQRFQSLDILRWPERINAWRGTRHEICDPVVKFKKPSVVFSAQEFGHKPGVEKKLPEPVRKTREVMADRGRSNTGVDSNKEHDDAGAYTVFETKVFPMLTFVLARLLRQNALCLLQVNAPGLYNRY